MRHDLPVSRDEEDGGTVPVQGSKASRLDKTLPPDAAPATASGSVSERRVSPGDRAAGSSSGQEAASEAIREKGADDIFELEYAGPRRRGKTPDIEDVIRRHPSVENGLRLLHAFYEEEGKEKQPLQPKAFVSHFEIVRKIDEGTFGEVFLALQRDPVRRSVALKVLRPESLGAEVLARFERERQVLMLLDHPGIARFYESGSTEDSRPFVAMEYVEGEHITAFCDRHHLDLRARLRLFLQLCEAVEHAHQRTIIHRDLKPSNVLVAGGDPALPVVKVIDFGLAKEIGGGHLTVGSVTLDSRAVVGTFVYMSPEQAGRRPGVVDTRTDAFSLGVILFELLTGRLPLEVRELREIHEARGFDEMLRIVRERERPRPSSRIALEDPETARAAELRQTAPGRLRSSLEDELDWVVEKSLRLEPKERFQNVSELAAEVRRFLAGEPLQTRPPTVIYRARKFIRQHRRAVAAVGAILAATVLVVAGLLGWQVRTSRALFARAREDYTSYLQSQRQVEELEEALRTEQSTHPRSRPPWRYEAEYRLWRELAGARTKAESLATSVEVGAQQALQGALWWSSVRTEAWSLISGLYQTRLDGVLRRGPVYLGPADFQARLESWNAEGSLTERERPQTFQVSTDPTGADVYLFRYVELCQRLIPLPWKPGHDGAGGDPAESDTESLFLEVDAAGEPGWAAGTDRDLDSWSDSKKGGLRPGDRIVTVAGRPVRTEKDLAQVLEELRAKRLEELKGKARPAGDPVEPSPGAAASPPEPPPIQVTVEVTIAGKDKPVLWQVALAPEAGGTGDPYDPAGIHPVFLRLGVTFSGYPLDISERSLVGRTPEGGSLALDLPQGSYLLVLRKKGHADVRYPVVSQSRAGEPAFTVRLPRVEEVPPGFVYVPAGVVATGGDPEAFQPLPWGTELVPSFFLARFEVTIKEWLEFVNDPATLQRTSPDGRLTSLGPSVLALSAEDRRSDLRVYVVPRSDGGQPRWDREGESPWTLGSQWSPQWPAIHLSFLAALEYIDWRNRRAEQFGEPWRYRLPTGREWERAARGVDRRSFVWGHYMIWTVCSSLKGNRSFTEYPVPFGAFPIDESVFGVRDLAGSVSEYTADRVFPKSLFPYETVRYRSYRGGNWYSEDEYFFRSATRNGMLPEVSVWGAGLRLAADPISAPVR